MQVVSQFEFRHGQEQPVDIAIQLAHSRQSENVVAPLAHLGSP